MRVLALLIAPALLAAPMSPLVARPPVPAGQAAPASTPSSAGSRLRAQVEALFAAAPAGARFGLMVTDTDGTPRLSIDPDKRFIPASNTKIFTTIAAYARLDALQAAAQGTGVRLEHGPNGRLSVVLEGRGDPLLSSAPDCATDCLATLADAVAARTRQVQDVIGDDRWYPDERWSPGMSWNNIPTRDGTGISALTLDDNAIALAVAPGAVGQPPRVAPAPYYAIDNRAVTVAGTASELDFARLPDERTIRIVGTLGAEAPAQTLRLGIDDPAHYAAWRLRRMLEDRGVRVRGTVTVRHRPPMPEDDPVQRAGSPAPVPAAAPLLAQLPAPALAGDIRTINKVSQNLHAELLLRRVARLAGGGSIADGQAALRATMAQAGVPRAGYDFSDGSGMSTYNRISPRAATRLLVWAARQPWGADWRASLPVGGVDGTLRRRYAGTPLEGKIVAKTGSLNASSALSGYVVAASGRTLVFSLFANDVPDERMSAAVATMDKALLAIAAAL